MRTLLTVLALVLAPLTANAAHEIVPLGTLLDDVALNAGASSRTFYVGAQVKGGSPTSATDATKGPVLLDYDKLRLQVTFDYTAQAGAITLTCTEGATRATTTAVPTTASESSGTYTLAWSGVVATPSLSADKTWAVVLNLNATPVMKCVASHGGTPGATDKISVAGWLIKKDG